MNATELRQQPRLLTPDELALFVRAFRESRQWSQDQLAEISRLNVRTIQQVEKGEVASFDTRRALAGETEDEQVKIEVNTVFQGSALQVERRALLPR